MLPGRLETGDDICAECAEITTNLTCDLCGLERERFRGGQCIVCVLDGELTALLKPHDPPDLRLKRLITVLTTVKRPESIYTWLRTNGGASTELLKRLGDRELTLSHEAFDALPQTAAVEHLRSILTHNHMLPAQHDRQIAVFEQWLNDRLDELRPTPAIHSPIERFAKWHHLRRLTTESSETKNMNYATRCAKQEITEAGKFLRWLLDEHGKTSVTMSQIHIDQYLTEGTSTRRHIRNFVRYLGREKTLPSLDVPVRLAKTTPMLTQQQRRGHIKTLLEAVNVSTSIRLAGLLFLLYGIPIGRLSMTTIDQVDVKPNIGITIKFGRNPAPVPDELIPLFLAHLQTREQQGTINTGTHWLFPGVRAGKPRSPNTLVIQLRDRVGINIQGVRNTTIRGLVEEIDPSSLSRMLGYSKQIMAKHATAATIPWSSYVIDKNPHYAHARPEGPEPTPPKTPS
ncbi:hypothetical protein B7R22_07825 [Subtercola boreus]|uniref:Uncharacterized protein n=1 Tax=Subtercola boreus TaxID=120213 RepID=A0A3E0VY23_9MICO|nr:hypothetical protein [Subtercola boreus]RFA14631.1 hypothetical protein B7R22_07825 [Subtercola boreus]